MLVIKVELWPGGMEGRKRTLCTGVVYNDGNGTQEVADYEVFLGNEEIAPWELVRDPVRIWRRGRVRRHHRQRHHVWNLIRKALDAAIEGAVDERRRRT